MRLNSFFNNFKLPLLVLIGFLFSLILYFLHFNSVSAIIAVLATILGGHKLIKDTILSLSKGQFALDYIAILAIIVSFITGEYLVAAIIALMIASGRSLEEYGVAQAKKSLTNLADRIPNEVSVWKNGQIIGKEKIFKIKVGEEILIRKGEAIGLDGILISKDGLTDESSLTGEPYTIEKFKGDYIRSGTINIGNPMVIKITKEAKDSTYTKIIDMVKKAQEEKAPLVRLADRYSTIFTIVTLLIAGFAYLYSKDLISVLSVLVIATPCPLILATPIALLGGVNASAKKRIIVKKLASLEVLSRINTIIFDKTGTITIGKPKVTFFENLSSGYNDKEILGIAEAIERNSLHPLAKAVVDFAKEKEAIMLSSQEIEEKVGLGISGVVKGKKYTLAKLKEKQGMAIELTEDSKRLALFQFEDEIKKETKTIIKTLQNLGFGLFIFTGDKKEEAEKVASQLGGNVRIKAECSPMEKQKGIAELKKQAKIIAMVGDGINDAPALALADVGMVFSNEEQTAASDAADIVFLGGDFSLVYQSLNIAKKTIRIALQSIVWGIGISIVGMVFASFGFIPPIAGAILQEAIDVTVIINALRASR